MGIGLQRAPLQAGGGENGSWLGRYSSCGLLKPQVMMKDTIRGGVPYPKIRNNKNFLIYLSLLLFWGPLDLWGGGGVRSQVSLLRPSSVKKGPQ